MITTEEFIERSKKVHGQDTFDYSKAIYRGNTEKITLACNRCKNVFAVRPNNHLQGNRCPYCYGHRLLTHDMFLEKCKQVHGDVYDYTKTKFTGSTNKFVVTCRKHGDFEKLLSSFVYNKQGCPVCSGRRSKNVIVKSQDKHEGLQCFVEKYKQQVSEDIFNRSQIFWFKTRDAGIICVNVNKNQHQAWNLLIVEDELEHVIEYINHGRLNEKVWCSVTPTLMNKWSKRAFRRILTYVRSMEEYRTDEM